MTAGVSRAARLARRFFDRFEPVHAVTYFAPEVRIALEAMGFHRVLARIFRRAKRSAGPGPR